MREIKFRGKNRQNGEWCFGYFYAIETGGGGLQCLINDKTGINEKEVVPETISQFTGLTDKNGVEIYEGDILECSAQNAKGYQFIEQVIWKNAMWRLTGSKHYGYLSRDLWIWTKKSIVIGNIYEHNHLLEQCK